MVADQNTQTEKSFLLNNSYGDRAFRISKKIKVIHEETSNSLSQIGKIWRLSSQSHLQVTIQPTESQEELLKNCIFVFLLLSYLTKVSICSCLRTHERNAKIPKIPLYQSQKKN